MESKELLTERESEVAYLLLKDYQKKEVANILFLSVRTVENHARNIYKKVGCNTTVGLYNWWLDKHYNISIDMPETLRKALAHVLLILMLFTIIPSNDDDFVRSQRRDRTHRTVRTLRTHRSRARRCQDFRFEIT